MIEAAGEEEEHQAEGVEAAGPEVVGRVRLVRGLGDEQTAAHDGDEEAHAVTDRVEDLFEHVVAPGGDVQRVAVVGAAALARADEPVDGLVPEAVVGQVDGLERLVLEQRLRGGGEEEDEEEEKGGGGGGGDQRLPKNIIAEKLENLDRSLFAAAVAVSPLSASPCPVGRICCS